MDYSSVEDFSQDIPSIFEQFDRSGKSVLCLCSVREALHEHIVDAMIGELASRNLLSDQVRFIFNHTVDLSLLDNRSCVSRIDNIDYFLCYSLYKTILSGVPVNEKWNKHSVKTLFLMGKADKHHRLPVLYHLTQKPEILKNLIYSFDPCTAYDDEHTKEILSDTVQIFHQHFPNVDYHDFSLKNACYLDISDPSEIASTGYPFHQGHTGFPFPHDLYADSLCSIVSESAHGEPETPTSPTWRPIINRHPFVLLDNTGNMHRYLRSLGIRTFEEFYVHSPEDIATADNPIQYAKMFAENAEHFARAISSNVNTVQNMIDNNYQVAIGLYKQYLSDLFNNNHQEFMKFVKYTCYPDWPRTS